MTSKVECPYYLVERNDYLTLGAVQACTVGDNAGSSNGIKDLLFVAVVSEDKEVKGGVPRKQAQGRLS